MPTAPESRIDNTRKADIDKLGIIAGGGVLPAKLAQSCKAQEISPYIIILEGQAEEALFKGYPSYRSRLGASGSIIRQLKEQNIKDLVLVGHIRRPSLKELRPDARTLKFFAKFGFKALGDDALLKALRAELEREGFSVHGVQEFLDDIIPPCGPIGSQTIPDVYRSDIQRGIEVLTGMGAYDIGQSIVVQEGLVLGVEAIEGTDELIRRCADYRREGRKPVLVKLAKPGQDKSLDLPTLGPETLERCIDAGFAGIVGHAGHCLCLSPKVIARRADETGLFVEAVDPDSFTAPA